ncbi:MAG: tail fiber domain-containing protein, partial [Lachnospira sp.]|nr:tail fiber domain-containing protein [Lachnospira sp.]
HLSEGDRIAYDKAVDRYNVSRIHEKLYLTEVKMVNTEEVIKKAKQAIKICSDIDTARAYVSDITNATKASLELKVDKNKLISEINASADVITLKSNRFVLDSTNAKIAADGRVEFTGGTIGGWKIDKHSLYSDYDKYRVYIQTVTGAEDWAFSVQEKKEDGKYYGNFIVDARGYVRINDGYLSTKNHSVGGKGIEINESTIKLYSWTDKDNLVGSIYSTYIDSGNSGSQNKRQSLVICSDFNDELHLDYMDENRKPYVAVAIDRNADNKVHMMVPTVFHNELQTYSDDYSLTVNSNFSVGKKGTEKIARFWCYNGGSDTKSVRIFNSGGESGKYLTNCELSLWGTGAVQYNWSVNGTIYGNISSDSDRNIKKDIKALDIENSAQFIYSLIPSEFRFKNGTSNRLHHGLIAQEVKESMKGDWGVFIDKAVDDKNYNAIAVDDLTGEQTQLLTARYGLRYDELIADLIATVQSLNNRLKALEK